MNQTAWNDWKSNVIGVLLMLLPLIKFFYPDFTAENQEVIVNGVGSIFDGIYMVVTAVLGIIVVIKTTWFKKKA